MLQVQVYTRNVFCAWFVWFESVTCVYMYVCILCVHMYVRVYVCMHHTHTNTHTRTHIHTNTHTIHLYILCIVHRPTANYVVCLICSCKHGLELYPMACISAYTISLDCTILYFIIVCMGGSMTKQYCICHKMSSVLHGKYSTVVKNTIHLC